MDEFIFFFKIFIVALTICYFLLILTYLIAWESIERFSSTKTENKTFVSIIVSARNEENNILRCLEHLVKQNYLPELFEIIIVNDFSEDSTEKIVDEFIQFHKQVSIRLINLSEIYSVTEGSKKKAINEGVKQAKGELIITTDADCVMNHNWIRSIVNYYENTSILQDLYQKST